MERQGGFIKIAEWRGAPIRVHLLSPFLGVIPIGFARPSVGAWLGLLLVVLAHEFGHALVVDRLGGVVREINVLPWGGTCEFGGITSELRVSCVAWGGVLAQMALLGLGQLQLSYAPPAPGTFGDDVLWSLTLANFVLMLVNLLPVRGLDGALAWRVFWLAPRAWLERKSARRKRLRVVGKDD